MSVRSHGNSGLSATAARCRMPAWWLPAILLVFSLVAGCAGYQVGQQALFYNNIRTVYVPVFESDSYRRNLGEWLTEAVVKEIELRSLYKVVHDPQADTVLYGRILSDRKYTISEDVNDNPRNMGFDLVVALRWVDRAGNTVLRSATVPIDLTLVGNSHFTAEGGQSMATAQQQVIRQTARQIVSQMEAGW